MGSSFISSQCFLRGLILSGDVVKAELLHFISAGNCVSLSAILSEFNNIRSTLYHHNVFLEIQY